MSIPATDPVLNRRENIDAVDQYGYTALMLASRNGCTATVEALIAEGADVNAVDKCGETALMKASRKRYAATVRTLIAGRANINLVNSTGDNALSLAKASYDLFESFFYYDSDDATVSLIKGGLKGLQNICKKRDATVLAGLPACMPQSLAEIIQDYDCDDTFYNFPPTSELVRKSIKEDSKKQAESKSSFSYRAPLSFSAMAKAAAIAVLGAPLFFSNTSTTTIAPAVSEQPVPTDREQRWEQQSPALAKRG